jgi:hypothetical protein
MVEYAQYTPGMAHDFELYSHNQEQHIDYQQNQSFIPASTFGMDNAFTAPFDHMAPLAEAPRMQNLQYHYDAIAQGVKPYQYQTPAASPHSTSNSFHEMPPVLSASSESGASVSSSAMGSPSLMPQFNDAWNPMSMGLTSGYEYPGMIANDKSYVGKSIVSSTIAPSSSSSSSSSAVPPMSPALKQNVFKTPVTPASATRPSVRSNSFLSYKPYPRDSSSVRFSSIPTVPRFPQSSLSCWSPSISKDS